ncbi:MAG: 50S ribosomal protein L15 [Gammaproteobacteria bacterium]|nr:50S ribosomal protein L15 [Gammaproteobacteria bacterium]
MGLENLKPTAGSIHHSVQVGRGHGCGLGKTSGRGQKGQGSRAGGGPRLGFTGGQTPLYKRLAKRGFTHVGKTLYAVVNVEDLNSFKAGSTVDAEALKNAGLVKELHAGVKVLGNGELKVKLNVKANKFSQSAKEKIEAAGGSVEEI